MRGILVVLDGLGDRGHPCFRGRTPLQAARTPNLDRLAALGMNGLYHAGLQGVALPSEIAHFLMFGYTLEEFPGRGLIEAVGEGIDPAPGDVFLLARLFCVRERDGMLILEVEDPEVEETLCRELQAEVRTFEFEGAAVEFLPTRGIQGILRLRGEISPRVTDSNPITGGRPLMEVLPHAGWERDPAVRRTAAALNAYQQWSYRRLSGHRLNRGREQRGLPPLNAVGLQRAGQAKVLPTCREKWGLTPLALATGPLYRGLGQVLGMALGPAADSGHPGDDLRKRLQTAREATDYDFVYIHTKAPDVAAHTKDPRHKRRVIESLDAAFAYALEEIVPQEDILLVVTADHSTNSAGSMIHSGESVPLLMVGKFPRRDGVKRFDEVSCAAGALSLVRGGELMHLMLNFLDRGKLFGLRDAPGDQPFSPGPYTPLKLR